jgi:hypothetical protein
MSDDEYFEPEIYFDQEPEHGGGTATAIIRLNNAFETLENLLMPFDNERRRQLFNAFDDAVSVFETNQTLAFNIISNVCSERTLQNNLLDTVVLVRSRMNSLSRAIRNDPLNYFFDV